jgi:Zn-dependent metalloprotease
MLKNFLGLRTPVMRTFKKTKKTLSEIIEYKKEKIPVSNSDQWMAQDQADLKKMANAVNDNKQYNRIQDDWKNNLIRKKKRYERRVEIQQTLPEVTVEDSKFIVHRYS